jgi:hypothetical protein
MDRILKKLKRRKTPASDSGVEKKPVAGVEKAPVSVVGKTEPVVKEKPKGPLYEEWLIKRVFAFVCPHSHDDSCASLSDSPPGEVCPTLLRSGPGPLCPGPLDLE